MEFEELKVKLNKVVISINKEPEEKLPFNKVKVSKDLIKFVIFIEECEQIMRVKLKLPKKIQNECLIINEYLDTLNKALKK
jgi:hypothetical protein